MTNDHTQDASNDNSPQGEVVKVSAKIKFIKQGDPVRSSNNPKLFALQFVVLILIC